MLQETYPFVMLCKVYSRNPQPSLLLICAVSKNEKVHLREDPVAFMFHVGLYYQGTVNIYPLGRNIS